MKEHSEVSNFHNTVVPMSGNPPLASYEPPKFVFTKKELHDV